MGNINYYCLGLDGRGEETKRETIETILFFIIFTNLFIEIPLIYTYVKYL